MNFELVASTCTNNFNEDVDVPLYLDSAMTENLKKTIRTLKIKKFEQDQSQKNQNYIPLRKKYLTKSYLWIKEQEPFVNQQILLDKVKSFSKNDYLRNLSFSKLKEGSVQEKQKLENQKDVRIDIFSLETDQKTLQPVEVNQDIYQQDDQINNISQQQQQQQQLQFLPNNIEEKQQNQDLQQQQLQQQSVQNNHILNLQLQQQQKLEDQNKKFIQIEEEQQKKLEQNQQLYEQKLKQSKHQQIVHQKNLKNLIKMQNQQNQQQQQKQNKQNEQTSLNIKRKGSQISQNNNRPRKLTIMENDISGEKIQENSQDQQETEENIEVEEEEDVSIIPDNEDEDNLENLQQQNEEKSLNLQKESQNNEQNQEKQENINENDDDEDQLSEGKSVIQEDSESQEKQE